jgi:hypothetical protein
LNPSSPERRTVEKRTILAMVLCLIVIIATQA